MSHVGPVVAAWPRRFLDTDRQLGERRQAGVALAGEASEAEHFSPVPELNLGAHAEKHDVPDPLHIFDSSFTYVPVFQRAQTRPQACDCVGVVGGRHQHAHDLGLGRRDARTAQHVDGVRGDGRVYDGGLKDVGFPAAVDSTCA